MLNATQLAQAAERLAKAATRPVTVIVFGSYARGDASEASDLDLLVIEPELPDKASEYLRLKAAVGRMGVGVDLLLFARPDFERRSQVPGTLPYWAKKEGKVLHDAAAWGLAYRRTHDLEELAGQLADAGCPPNVSEADLRLLTPYAVEYRYDDEAPELLTPPQALSIVASLLAWCDAQVQQLP